MLPVNQELYCQYWDSNTNLTKTRKRKRVDLTEFYTPKGLEFQIGAAMAMNCSSPLVPVCARSNSKAPGCASVVRVGRELGTDGVEGAGCRMQLPPR